MLMEPGLSMKEDYRYVPVSTVTVTHTEGSFEVECLRNIIGFPDMYKWMDMPLFRDYTLYPIWPGNALRILQVHHQ